MIGPTSCPPSNEPRPRYCGLSGQLCQMRVWIELDRLILDMVLIGYAPSRPGRMKSATELLNLLRKKNFFFGFAMLQSMPALSHAPLAWNRRKQSIATTREAGVWR